MHEMSIAENLIDIIKEEMAKHNVQVLKSVRLEIGQLSAIIPASLSFCFVVMTKGTDLEGADLIMEMVPLKSICRECHETFEILDYTFICPHCACTDIQTIAGQNLSIVEINAI
jgi:hydrogenase nickel incorporation protein HypA/HybF